MKKISTILIIFICLIFAANFSLAKMGIKKPIVIPPEMQKMESPFELETYLGNPDSRIREAAVIRLGQIGGSDAIPVLLKFFENEPETKGVIDVPYGVKEAVVVALRQIGGEEAKEQILKLLSDTLKFGPIANAYKEKRYTGQASHIIYLSIEALSDFPDDNVIRMLAAEKIRPKKAVVVLGLSQGGYPQPTRSGPSAEHGFGMAVDNRRRVSDGGDFFLKSILFVTF